MIEMKKITLLLILLFLLSNLVICQTTNWIKYQKSPSFCNNKLELSNNIYWVSTNNGLVKFNKTDSSLSTINNLNAPIEDNNIGDVVCSTNGDMWCVTGSGFYKKRNLLRFKNGVWENFIDFPNMPNLKSILRTTENGDLIFTNRDSLYWFNGFSLKSMILADPLISNFIVYDIAIDINQYVWVATNRGLHKMDFKTNELSIVNRMHCTSLAINKDGELWIGTNDSGIYKYSDDMFINYNDANSDLPCNNISSMKYDLNGNLWLSTSCGLVKFNGTRWNTYEIIDVDIYGKDISNFITDSTSISFIWKGNIMEFDGTKTEKYKIGNVSQTLLSNDIGSFTFDDKNNLWIASNDSMLQCLKNDVWENYSLKDTLQLDTMFSKVYSDTSCFFWLGKGILINCDMKEGRYDWHVANATNRHKSDKIKVDKSNAIWRATNQGLLKYYNGTITTFNTTNSPLPTNNITYLAFDKNEQIIISTLPSVHQGEKGVLMSYDGNAWNTIYSCSMDDYFVSSMIYDNKDNLWFGVIDRKTVGKTFGGGLFKYNGINFSNYTIYNSSLSSNSIFALNVDNNNNLLVGTCTGGFDIFDGVKLWTNFCVDNSPIDFNTIKHIEINSVGDIAASVQFFGFLFIPNDSILSTEKKNNNPINNDSYFSIFPNPCANFLNVKFNKQSIVQNGNVSIYQATGKKVLNYNFNNKNKPELLIPVSSLLNGMYLINIKADGVECTKPFIKSK